MTLKKLSLLALCLCAVCHLHAQSLTQKANDFLNSLSPELKAKTQFPLTDVERFNMSYVPISRKGPSFHDFTEKQTLYAIELLKASLSKEGYRKASEIMTLDNVLIVLEENKRKMPDGSPMRDALNYHFCIFGDPSDEFWGWRFEGHHVSLNFSSVNNKIVSSTPSFFGSNPGIVNVQGFDKKQILKLESDLGFALVNSLDADQLLLARYSERAPGDIVTRNVKKVGELEKKGVSYQALTNKQKKIFGDLLDIYISNYELGFSKTLFSKIEKAGMNNLLFSWAGSLAPGAGHYYRIQGPTVLIEFDNTQDNANHIHSVVRDLTNDYGEDILKEHYQKDHQ